MATSARTFRIFVSSTFSDLKEERNALQEGVFPRLRKLCSEHGCRFQAVDLRWGVSEEAALDQQTMSICLGEIDRCQRTSPRPNFIVLLGKRYGWLPLPFEIPVKEFDQLLPLISDEASKLIRKWYRRDDNAVPSSYCLQPRVGKYVEYENWEKIELKLHAALEAAARKLEIFPDQLLKYTASATEQEIANGALRVVDALDHVFCYFREIDELPEKESQGFVDLDPDGLVDTIAAKKLSDLKANLDRYLTKNVHRYSASWFDRGPTLDHLEQLCEDVYQDLEKVILTEIALLDEEDPLDSEIKAHENFGTSRAQHFIGRAEILASLEDYLTSQNQHPLAVYGESGSGKSALLAKAVEQAKKAHPRAEIVCHYIGATPESSSARAMLRSLCEQIRRIFGGKESELPTHYADLIQIFPEYLAKANPHNPLFIFIDALDQLSNLSNARSLDWLPPDLPPNTKVVVSTLPVDCLKALKRKLDRQNLLEMQPMPVEEGANVLDLWLSEAKRTLQQEQKQYLLSKFKQSGLPLYLKLAFEEARRWVSFDSSPQLRDDIPGIVSQLFKRLSQDSNHGEMLVERSLSYLATAKNGLSEDELIDVLSLDEEVLADFHRRSPKSPPVSHLPVVLLSRLYFDLEPYLTEVAADQTTLLRFYHGQVREVVAAKYLENQEKMKRHQALAAYFAKQDIGVRKVEELPWQFAQAGDWQRLSDLLADWMFFEFAWRRDRFAVERYWAQVEANSRFRMADIYKTIQEQHSDKLEYISDVAHLLDETSHAEDAAALRDYLLEQRRGQVNPIELISALNEKGVSLKNSGDLDGAMQAYKEAEAIIRNLDDRQLLANILSNQGNILRRQKKFDLALAILKEAVQCARDLADHHGLIAALNALSLVYFELEDYANALPLLKEQENLCRESGDRMGLAAALGNQASILAEQGDSQPEELLSLRAQEAGIYRDLGVRTKLEQCLVSQAGLLHKQAHSLYKQSVFKKDRKVMGKVIALYSEEEKIWNELNRLDGATIAQSDRAVVMALLGQREARSLVEQAYSQAVSNNLTEATEKIKQAMDVVFSMVD